MFASPLLILSISGIKQAILSLLGFVNNDEYFETIDCFDKYRLQTNRATLYIA